MIQSQTVLAERYEILNLIGSGGMADVYRAKCHQLNRYVAVKVLRQEHNEDEEFVRRFIAEAQATAGFTHPNIVGVYDAGEDQGYHYIVMELCEGTTLKQYIRRYGRLSVRETVDYAKQITLGLQAAHREGIVHRDIKPQNILVSDSGKIKVADFGIARAATGATIGPNLMGSVHYFSPEQAKGGFADERSDLYSLGITMYEMATGKVPFDGETPISIALMHLNEEITPPKSFFPDIPASLEKIILKLTMKRPMDRYQTAQEVLDDLEKVFSLPDGEYVVTQPLVDDSPTRIETTKKYIKVEENETVEDNSTDSDDKEALDKDFLVKEDQETISEEEDDDSMQPHMQRLIYVILGICGVFLILIFVYFIGSALGVLRLGRPAQIEATTEVTTEAKVMVSVPNVLKMDRVSAEKTMEIYHLKARFVYENNVTNNDTHLIVVKQQYKAGEQVEENSIVELTLGLNPEAMSEVKRVEVPSLVDLSEQEAEKALLDVDLLVKKVYATSDTVKPGYVIKQNPTAGTEVDVGFTIIITVSKGVSQVKVPTVTGLSQEEAKAELNRVGLNLGNVTSDYNGSVSVGEVFEQEIPPGTMVDRGTAVSVVISLGENISYHYEGEIYITKSPFADGTKGSMELFLDKDNTLESIYSNDNMSANDFPFHYIFEGEEGDAVVRIYINGEEYDSQVVKITAVED